MFDVDPKEERGQSFPCDRPGCLGDVMEEDDGETWSCSICGSAPGDEEPFDLLDGLGSFLTIEDSLDIMDVDS